MTLITPRRGGMLVVTRLAVIGSRPLLNSVRGMRFALGSKPTTLPSLFSYAITREADRATLDIGCWWWKHFRLPIGDQERGWINYSKHWFQTHPCFSCFLFFVLRTPKWQRTVNLWLRTSFCCLRLSAFCNAFLLSTTLFCFLQRLFNFPQWLSNFPQRFSTLREIQENLSTAASIQKIAIWAL